MSGASVVLAERPLPGRAYAALAGVEDAGGDLRAAVGERREDVTALIAVDDRVDADLVDRLPNLRLVARFGIGYDKVDVAHCTASGVAVSVTPDAVTTSTAELAVLLIMALAWRLPEADATVRGGGWSPTIEVMPEARSLGEMTVGIVGLGRIGRRVAQRLQAFGTELVYSGRRRLDARTEATFGVRFAPLDGLLSSCDAVTLHTPLTDATRGMIGAAELGRCRPGTIFVNTARGGLVDEAALVAAVTAGRVRAGLDVFAHEPDVPAALRDSPAVLLTPHVGSATRRTRERLTEMVVESVQAALDGRPIPNQINAEKR
jgi:phosphoglycerate dehydrogenase-like enzyme